jgi:hypothetical protein
MVATGSFVTASCKPTISVRNRWFTSFSRHEASTTLPFRRYPEPIHDAC